MLPPIKFMKRPLEFHRIQQGKPHFFLYVCFHHIRNGQKLAHQTEVLKKIIIEVNFTGNSDV